MSRILVIEDELPMRNALFDLLTAQSFRVVTESDGERGLARALSEELDLVLLDIMMPKLDGFAVCAEIRRRLPKLPILMLTAKSQIDDRVTGLDAGADDYLVKPFSSRELLARVRALLRRFDRSAALVSKLSFGEIEIDFSKHTCQRAGAPIALTAKEFGVLKLLAEHAGEPVTREHFLEVVWSYNAYPTTRTVDNQMLSLRAKLEADPSNPRHLLTVHGVGYRLEMTNP
ncbi:MAG TPA: response regulator transcription factor [Chthoniobacteraceae bacterium]|jgi:DNA-binding response OmpR family regulator